MSSSAQSAPPCRNLPNPKDPDWTCLHKGAALQSILVYPEIQSFTVFTKDNDGRDLGRAFAKATRLLIAKYPMLRGELAIVKNKTVGTQLWVRPGARSVSDDFFTAEDWTGEQSLAGMARLSLAECLVLVQTHVAPRTANPLNTTEQEGRQAALCQVRLLTLPDGYYCLLVGVSHAIADGGTYYRLLDELVALVAAAAQDDSGVPSPANHKPALDWDNPALSTHEFGGAGGLPFLLGLLWSVLVNLFYPRPKAQILVFDRQKINQQKTSLKDAATPYLSSNDIVVAALQQANATRTMTSLIVNDRARLSHLVPHDAGNYLSSLLLPTRLGRNPNRIRQVVTAGTYYDDDNNNSTAPTAYLYRMSIMILSSWATAQGEAAVTPTGTRLVCHLPHPAFVESFPLDVAVVFAASKDCLAVSHNFYASYWKTESKALLDAIAVTHA
jgi:hypothetical protein